MRGVKERQVTHLPTCWREGAADNACGCGGDAAVPSAGVTRGASSLHMRMGLLSECPVA